MTLQYCTTIYVMCYKYKYVVQKLLRGTALYKALQYNTTVCAIVCFVLKYCNML
jgi:hypothetical protein